jgi:hypothetical protein
VRKGTAQRRAHRKVSHFFFLRWTGRREGDEEGEELKKRAALSNWYRICAHNVVEQQARSRVGVKQGCLVLHIAARLADGQGWSDGD